MLPQKNNSIVFQGIDAHGAVQHKFGGFVVLRSTFSAHRVFQNAGFFHFFCFTSWFTIFACFRLVDLVFSHARPGVKGYLATLDLGKLRPVAVAIHEDSGVVLYIADQNRGADFYVGARLGVLHGKLETVFLLSGGLHKRVGTHIDSAVCRLRILDGRSRDNNILPDGHIGVIGVGNDAHGGAEAKGGVFLSVIAALVSTFQFVLDILDAAFTIAARGVFRLVVVRVHERILEDFGGIDGVLLALFLVLGFFTLLFGRVRIVLLLFRFGCLRSVLARFTSRRRSGVIHRHLHPGDIIFRFDIHGSCRNGTI